MPNLMLHCGAHHADRDEVTAAPTPARTQSWVPIPHHHLLDRVESTLAGCGMRIVNEAHGLWGDGQRYFGLLEVRNGKADGDYGLVVGLRNSHDKTFPAAIASGAAVFCCDNLSFSGEVKLARRHTRFIERDLPRVVSTAVGRLTDMRHKQDDRITHYKATEILDRQAHDLVVRALDAGVVPASQLPKVLAEWREPQHSEFAEGGRTGWRLFNAFTEVLKGRNLAMLPRRTQALHGLLDAECGLAV